MTSSEGDVIEPSRFESVRADLEARRSRQPALMRT